MNHISKIMCLVAALIIGCGVASAQKEEIKAFKEINKVMLKDIKKYYKTEPKVEMSKYGDFWIIITGKVNKTKKYILISQDGQVLNNDPVDKYDLDVWDGYVAVADKVGDLYLYGAYDKNGNEVLPRKYRRVYLNSEYPGGYNASNVWYPAMKAAWLTIEPGQVSKAEFFSLDGKTSYGKCVGDYTVVKNRYLKIGQGSSYGLYTGDGQQIFPQEYDDFMAFDEGFIVCSKKETFGNRWKAFYGGRTINPDIEQYMLPNLFSALRWHDGGIQYKLHRGDEYQPLDKNVTYTVEYLDEGHKYYDFGDYDNVISYYEGEGMDKVHGPFFMGMATKEKGDAELKKLKDVVSTLKHETKYYLPLDRPQDYTFSSMLLGSAFIEAQSYFDRFIHDERVNPDDPMLQQAKKMRGETASSKNEVTKMMDEYQRANILAAEKWANAKHQAAVKKAQEDAAAEAIGNAIGNLLFSGSSKKR